MGTRSSIAIKHGERIKAIYCHWDGYLEGVGATLSEHYSSSPKVNNLIALGDVSSLGEEIGVEHAFSTMNLTDEEKQAYELEHGRSCTFYGRDRGEEGVEFRSFGSEAEWIDHYEGAGAQYFYLFDHGVWYYSTGGDLLPLHEHLKQETANA